jgi:hypothetical protein
MLLQIWDGLTLLILYPYAVTRIEAKSEDMYMQLDVATEVYPVKIGDKFNMLLASTLNLDGTPDTGYYTQVMHLTHLTDSSANCTNSEMQMQL